MTISKELILRDYQKLKSLAAKNIRHKHWESACIFTKMAANLMYNSNLIYADDELEENLKKIAESVLEKPVFEKGIEARKKIVFYDYFMLDNRGLTEQYLSALLDSDYEVLFVGYLKGEKSKYILDKLAEHKIKTYFIDGKKELERAKEFFNAINAFKPSIIFAHTSPWDVAGLVAINRFENCCRRYLTNITDHAFWLGTKCFDYFLEFRNYGYNISKNYRHIEEKKLLKLPYYPIVNKNIQFGGFNFDCTGKTLIFSGGSIYKIQGSPAFLEIVKYILTKYENTNFLFLGNGDFSYLQDFIKENHFQNRFFYESERKDIWEVFCRCDLYLNTYPLIGGLMTQYACMAGKVPLTLNDKEDACNDVYELMTDHFGLNFQFKSIEELKTAFDEYMQKPEKMKYDGELLKEAIIKTEDFRRQFLKYLDAPENQYRFTAYKIDIEKFAETYIERFNEKKCSYYSLFLRRDLKGLQRFFRYYFFYLLIHFCRLFKAYKT